MRTINKISVFGTLAVFTLVNIVSISSVNASSKIVYPLKEVSKLECRFTNFKDLTASCKEQLPILKTKDYNKYAKKDGGYNSYTRLYTVLWGSSYKYGWDVGNGGHIGTDIATSKGTPVYSIADGEVIIAGSLVALGNTVSVRHTINGKTIVSNYSHMSKITIKKGDKIKAGKKIGEVGSTGNSTGNHLHFQIDLGAGESPYYYNYKTCPYSYYQISENGMCFDELKNSTIDPLRFLETNGAVLDQITITNINSSNGNNTSKNNKDDVLSIFDRTVYVGYSNGDIRKVQQIYKDLGVYSGKITSNYKDIENDIINYQLKKGIIDNKSTYGAGWFGPKTREVTKNDYVAFMATGEKSSTTKMVTSETTNDIKIEKISRKQLLTREEIEIREVEEFLKDYKIELKLENIGGNIELNKANVLKLKVSDKQGRLFKGTMPGGMTFIVDTKKVNVFPQKLFYFTDGKRDISLTGLQEGNTTLYVKIGNQTVKSFPIKVYNSGKVIYPDTAKIISNSKAVLGENKTGIVLFLSEGRKLINLKYSSTFRLKTNDDVKVCIKRGTLKDIKKIYKTPCKESDFNDTIDFKYSDTVAGLVIYDYKIVGKNPKVEIINNYKNLVLSTKKIRVSNPKGLSANYDYKDEVIDMLEEGIVGGINKGYFLEDRGLSQKDALNWVENLLKQMNKENLDPNLEEQISINLKNISQMKLKASIYKTYSREEFLKVAYVYLVFNKDNVNVARNYRDLDDKINLMANAVFVKNNTWKDQFGENYFKPNDDITRGEGAFLLSNILEKNKQMYLTLR